MTVDVAAAQALLDATGGIDEIGDALVRYFARLIGARGIQSVLDRALALTAARHAWLAPPPSSVARPGWALREAFAQQPRAVALEGLADLLSTFRALLGRFIGDALVERALRALWPDVFPKLEKELH